MHAVLPSALAHGAASVSVTDSGPARSRRKSGPAGGPAPRVRFPSAPDVA